MQFQIIVDICFDADTDQQANRRETICQIAGHYAVREAERMCCDLNILINESNVTVIRGPRETDKDT